LDDFFEIGIILKPQGLTGELRIFPTTDDPERFALLDEVHVSVPGKPDTIYKLEQARRHKNLVFVKLNGVTDRNAAEALVKGVMRIPPDKALPLDTDEYYIRDLVGLSVWTDKGEALGILQEVLHTGANDVYMVKTPDGKEILLPAIKRCIISISLPDNKMVVNMDLFDAAP
jgi:16S rRNA processing protein RimM